MITMRQFTNAIPSLEKEIFTYISQKIKTEHFEYETFGKSVEKHMTEIILKTLIDKGIITEKDYRKAKDKNDHPDLTIYLSKNPLALEYKVGNHSKKQKGVWKKCNNSGNDLGTIRTWEKGQKNHVDEFDGENIYFVFVEYDFTDKKEEIVKVTISPFYTFVGKNKQGMLKYREKDGNLRPRNFDEKPQISSFEEFSKLLLKTKVFRSERIIKKHWDELPQAAKEKLAKSLGI